MKVGEAIVEITGDTKKLDQSLKDSQGKVKSSADKMKKALLPVGMALTAVGAAGLKVIDSARKMNAQLGVTAMNLGISTKEMRNLALETTNVTFPLKEVTATFDLLARAGVKDAEVLATTATAFDTLGDATGQSASQVTQMMIPAMKTFGLTAEEMAKKTDMMTYMSRKSTMTMQDFNTMVGYTTPELVAAGLTMEDLTAALIYMEEQGYAPGRVMTREFMKATTLATKEQIPLTEALGMTTEQTEAYKEELAGATGMTQEYADVANEQYGIMDKVRQKFDELVLSAGTFLEPLEPILAGMTALGPLMIALSTSAGTAAAKWGLHTIALVAHKVALIASAIAIKAVTAAQWLWNAAMTANPIGLIIAGIGALIAAGIALWKNWDKVTAFFEMAWRNIRMFFLKGVYNILHSLSQVTKFIPGLNKLVDSAKEKIAGMIDAEKVTGGAVKVERALGEVGDATDRLVDNWERLPAVAEEAAEEVAETWEETTDKMLDNIRDLTDKMKDNARESTRVEIDAINDRMDAHREAHQERMDILRDEYDQTIKTIDAELSASLRGYQDQIEAIDKQIEEIENAERGRRDAERKAELEASISEEKDADKRLDTEERLNELIIESDNDLWRGERELAYETRIAEEKDADERRRLEKQLADFLLEVQARRTRLQLESDRDTLHQEMDMAREEARNAKDQAQEAYDYERDLQETAFNNLISHLETEKEALDLALEETLQRYDDDEAAFKAMLGEEIKSMADFIRDYNELIAQLKDKTITITTEYKTVGVPSAPQAGPERKDVPSEAYGGISPGEEIGDTGFHYWGTTPKGAEVVSKRPPETYEPREWLQKGGIAMRPITARIAEREPEAVLPLDRNTLERLGLSGGGYRTANIYVMLNDGVLAEAVEVRMVDDMRLRMGSIL